MRSTSDPTASAFSYAFLGHLPEHLRRPARQFGAILWDAIVLSDPTEDQNNTAEVEIAATVADLLVAAEQLETFREFLDEFPDREDEQLLQVAADCGSVARVATEPLLEELMPAPADAARAEMRAVANQLRDLRFRLDEAAARLGDKVPEEQELAGLIAFVTVQRLTLAISDLTGTARPEEN